MVTDTENTGNFIFSIEHQIIGCDLPLNHLFIFSDLNDNNFFMDKHYLETEW